MESQPQILNSGMIFEIHDGSHIEVHQHPEIIYNHLFDNQSTESTGGDGCIEAFK